MITILADLYKCTAAPQAALVAESVSDYVTIRQQIRQALNQQSDLTIYIADSILLHWLSDLRQYPTRIVEWHDLNPTLTFRNYFGIEPKLPFTPELLALLQIDTLPPLPIGQHVDPVGWILGVRLSDLWLVDAVDADHSAQFAIWAAQQENKIHPALYPLLDWQLAQWSEQDPLYRSYRSDHVADDGRSLIVRFMLRHYSPEWRSQQSWGNVPLLRTLEPNHICIAALQGQAQNIRSYWQNRYVAANYSPDLITRSLDEMSGMSEDEAYVLNMLLKRHPAHITEELITRLHNRFKHLPQYIDIFGHLEAQIVPQQPPLPAQDWSTAQWLHWATQVYMPYFAWTIRHKQDRSHQQACANLFSDWIYNKYPAWLNDDQAPLLLQQYQHFRSLLDNDPNTIVVWLIVDNLTWWQGSLLRAACEAHGLHVAKHEPAIAVLPSITSVSKRALVTGTPPTQLSGTSIAKDAQAKLSRLGIPGHISYNLPSALQAVQQQQELRALIVFFNMLDIVAHQTTEFTDDSGVRGYITDLAEWLSQIQMICEQQGRPLSVLIGSDHGSTLLPLEAHSIHLPQFSQAIDDTWEAELPHQEIAKPNTRAAHIGQLGHLQGADYTTWYVLDREQFHLDRHYLIPRSYNYIGRRPTGWTHGGLTPEEVIVPMMHFTPEHQIRLPLHIELSGALRAYLPVAINMRIMNPNQFPIDRLSINLEGENIPLYIEHIDGMSNHSSEIMLSAITPSSENRTVYWSARYDTLHGTQTQRGQQQLQVRRLQIEDSGLDDMFMDT